MTNSELFALSLPVFGGGSMLLFAGIVYYQITHSARRRAARSIVTATGQLPSRESVDLEKLLRDGKISDSEYVALLHSIRQRFDTADEKTTKGVVIDLMDALRDMIARERTEEKRQPENTKT
jgi:hypothetical protein